MNKEERLEIEKIIDNDLESVKKIVSKIDDVEKTSAFTIQAIFDCLSKLIEVSKLLSPGIRYAKVSSLYVSFLLRLNQSISGKVMNSTRKKSKTKKKKKNHKKEFKNSEKILNFKGKKKKE